MKRLILCALVVLSGIAYATGLSGTYYIGASAGTKPGGGDPDYASMSAAVSALNTNGVAGACTFYFLDAAYTEASDFWLGCSGTSATNTITFKPYTGVTTTITFGQTTLHPNTATTGLDGHFIIASPTGNNSDIVPTHYVTIDGSNTQTLVTQYESIHIVSDGTAWFIV